MSVTYFAYGANLDVPAMQARCPGAIPLQTAALDGHRLVSMREGWLSITPDADHRVVGLLWTLEASHLAALDVYEEVAEGLYVHDRCLVEASHGTMIFWASGPTPCQNDQRIGVRTRLPPEFVSAGSLYPK